MKEVDEKSDEDLLVSTDRNSTNSKREMFGRVRCNTQILPLRKDSDQSHIHVEE